MPSSISRKAVFHCLTPELRDRRGDATLLVWGALAQWIVADDELLAFLGRFDGRRDLRQAIRKQAKALRRPASQVEAEAMPVVAELQRRGILSQRARPAPLPEEPVSIANVTLNITNRCNLRCRMCYNRGHLPQDAPVPRLLQGLRAGREVLEPDASLVVLGGEPTLDPQRLLALLEGTQDLFGQAPVVSTNGTLVDEALAAQLAERGAELQISLDHHLAAGHDALRGPGSFEKALRGARRLLRAGAYTMLCRVYARGDGCAIEPYMDLALELGVQEVRLIPMRCIGAGVQLQQRAPDQLALLRSLLELLGRRPELAQLLVRDWFSIAASILGRGSPRGNCGIGRRVVLIDADGLVYPCPNHTQPEHAAGDLAQQDLATIVRSSDVFCQLRARYHVGRYTRCQRCPFRHWCAGDCRGEVLAISGDPHGPSPHCVQLRQVYKELLWLMAAERCPLGERARLPDGRPVPRRTFV